LKNTRPYRDLILNNSARGVNENKNSKSMNRLLTVLVTMILLSGCHTTKKEPKQVITTDIAHFWEAYDKITSTQDSVLQYNYLDSLYFQRGTPGLSAIRQARNYTPQDYINAILDYPHFWASIRETTLKADEFKTDIEIGIERLRDLYPELKPATIYFTMGAFRTNGTFRDKMVLIGSELAMTDKNTVSSDFPAGTGEALRTFFDTNPLENLVLLNVHEYVHTQQKPLVDNILSYAIYEGVAEYVSSKALGVPSPVPAIEFGKNNAAIVRDKFEREMFYINNRYKWLYGNAPNEFGIRDLGYYIGYQMCENYYEQAADKTQAIKDLIALDYENETEIEAFVAATGFFSKPLGTLYKQFEESRPFVFGIKQFENETSGISPKITEITIQFSGPLNGRNTGVDFGELGEEAFPKSDFTKRYWSEDNTSWTMAVDLEPNKRYQILISNNFRTEEGIPLKPYLIDFVTGDE
jgi:hypothetical protein